MFCSKCGARIENGGKFCPKCGAPVMMHHDSGSVPAVKTPVKPAAKSARKPAGKLVAGIIVGLLALALVVIIVLLVMGSEGVVPGAGHGQEKEEWSALSELDQESEPPKEAEEEETQEEESDMQTAAAQTEQAEPAESEVNAPVINSYECIKMDCTWSEAARLAEESGGHLVTINSEEENLYVKNLLTLEGVKIYWIGANDLENGTYAWIDGTSMSYTDWHDGEPNRDQGVEHYAALYQIDGVWKWNDLPDDLSQYYTGILGFVIEYETNAR